MAPKREFAGSSLPKIPTNGLPWSLYECVALWRAVYGPAIERPLELLVLEKRREFLPGYGFLSRRDNM